MLLIKKIYFTFNKDKLERAKMKLRKISINKVQFLIEKQCKNLNINYLILVKEKNNLVFKLKVKNKNIILKFHKDLAITLSDYNNFMTVFNKEDGYRGYYVTTGVFHHDIYSKNYLEIIRKKIDIIDGNKFLLNQKWFKSFNYNNFNYNDISFNKYFKV
ncbi:hypothetical protein [Clostridium tarantellae]|uniref:Uncharacterized protein n=1 Tax=Clostridium tarantellae TaxID=39493 RepID=A0A6I1MSZ8_9CLOT|nr:hypothetical protein [Clostridium tarantellae]MPQ43359.1 hypothetical protein [Clostridium tarantellae]